METVRYQGEEFEVQELSRPAGWLCRHLASADGVLQFLEYVVSVGPYKRDVCYLHKLSRRQLVRLRSGTLSLGELARQLAEKAEQPGKV